MQSQLFPKEIMENTSEVYLPKVSVKGQLIYSSVLVFILIALSALPFIEVDISVSTSGIIRTVLEKNELKTIVSGSIVSIHVQDNQNVQKGDLLFALSTEVLNAQLRLKQSQQNQQGLLIQDLKTLLAFKNFEKPVSLVSALYTQQYNQLYFALLEKKSQLQKASLDLARANLLFEQKVIAAVEKEEKQFAFDKLEAEYQTLVETQRSQWSVDLNRLKISISELQSQARQIKEEKALYQIKAPESGTFQISTGKYTGTYIQSGEVLGIISPNSSLIAECYLSPKDIGLIKKGMETKFKIDAFNYTEWGFVKGEIIDIGQDYILLDKNPVFKVKCKLKSDSISLKNGFTGKLKKGMTLQARFIVSQRSLFQLLYDNVDDWMNPSNKQ